MNLSFNKCPKELLDYLIDSQIKPSKLSIKPKYSNELSNHSNDEVWTILSYLNPDMSYDDWYKVGMALHEGGYDVSLWDNWSARGSKYQQGECHKKWQSFTHEGGISMGTLVKMAQNEGYKGHYQSQQYNRKNTMNVNDFNGQFEPIIPFSQFNTPTIPCNILPSALEKYGQNISDILSVPTALCVINALAIASCALNGKYVVSPKADWKETINIYAMSLLPPASNKSLVLNLFLSPVNKWEIEQEKKLAPLRDKAMQKLNAEKLKATREESIIKRASSKEEDIKAAEVSLEKLLENINKLTAEIPVIPQIYANDVTPESLATCIEEQNNIFAIISDEGGVTETLSGLYTNGQANVDIILKGHDGGATRIRRKDKEYHLTPLLVVMLSVQPQILQNMADKKSFKGNGALERYLYILPETNIGYRNITDDSICDNLRHKYEALMTKLLDLPMPDEPEVLELTTQSKIIFKQWREEIERKNRPDGELYICTGWAGKLAGATLRIAGILHIVEHPSGASLIIDEKTMNRSVQLAKLLCGHVIAAYGLMALDENTANAKEIYEWLKTLGVNKLSKSELIKAFKGRKFGKKELLDKAIQELIERNILSEMHEDKSTAKATQYYFINMDIYK